MTNFVDTVRDKDTAIQGILDGWIYSCSDAIRLDQVPDKFEYAVMVHDEEVSTLYKRDENGVFQKVFDMASN